MSGEKPVFQENPDVPLVKGKFTVIGKDCEIGDDTDIWNMVFIGDDVKLGKKVTVSSLVQIADEVVIGDWTQIEGSAYIGRGSSIGKDCFIGPNATIAGDSRPSGERRAASKEWKGCVLEDDVIVGANAVIRPGVKVGRRSVVGMGAVVLEDVPPESVVVGSPARVVFTRDDYDMKQQAWARDFNSRVTEFGSLPDQARPSA